MDFEEFLWAKGYKDDVIDDMLNSIIKLEPLSNTMYDVMLENFKEYMITGGMPAIVSNFIESKNFECNNKYYLIMKKILQKMQRD